MSFLTSVLLPVVVGLAVEPLEGWGTRYGLVLGVGALVIFAVMTWLMGRQDVPGHAGLEEAADELAESVRQSWGVEARRRRLGSGDDLLTFAWRPAGGGVAARSAQEHLDECALRGIPALVEAYSRVPSKRLAIIGEAGLGKTSLALLLTLGLVERRRRLGDGPVPVKLSAATWDPLRDDLLDWMEARLAEQFVFLRGARYEPGTPRRLLTAKLVLPILDGLDELRTNGGETRRKAVEQIAEVVDSLYGLVVTCRADQYTAAVREGGPIPETSVAELLPLDVDNVVDYLERSAADGDRWEPLFEGLRRDPHGDAATVLSTPLMVSLARDVYRRGETRPEELLTLPSTADIERHLARELLPAKFPDLPRSSRRGGWHGADVRRWLGFLAAEMEHRREREIAWWRLPRLAGRPHRVLAGAVSGLAAGATAALTAGGAAWFAWGRSWGLAAGAVGCLVFGVPLAVKAARNLPQPSEMQFGGRGRLPVMLQGALFSSLAGAVAGWLVGGADRAVLVGAIIGVPLGLAYTGAQPDATVRLASPRVLFRRDACVVVIFGAAYGLSSCAAAWLLIGPLIGGVLGVSSALCGGLLYGLPWWLALRSKRTSGLVASAHLVLYTLILAPQGKSPWPWRLMAFLEEARDRDVLRQVGPVYEFRHSYLRKVLAESSP
ncbi:hypothetical protein DFJ69_3680 [Thermomonospora umbrina]|uniref:NACHT domain-containing protein n=1 Tax=Thermomonospora umbrina TaxID=111806 RepID=A0A3D9SQE7_9ACTN|nr:hypothetical protein DFJ69_3680 [Thermomonospora umbrina]